MRNIRYISVLFLTMMLGACATVYTAEDFSDYQAKHEKVAILPYEVTIQLKKMPEGMTIEDIEVMQKDEGYLFQEKLYAQFLQRVAKGEYTVEFQDIDQTNVLLEREDIGYASLGKFTKQELAQKLGVDSIISGDIKRTKPQGGGMALATTLLFGIGVTNSVNINMRIHDAESGTMLWSYDHEVDGGIGSNPERMAKSLMKNVSKKFPYTKK